MATNLREFYIKNSLRKKARDDNNLSWMGSKTVWLRHVIVKTGKWPMVVPDLRKVRGTI
jgi:hypothetical protein